MLRDNLVELIEPMLNSAGADPLALYIHTQTPASDDRLPCLKNPRPEGAESSLTESASSPFQAEPAQCIFTLLSIKLRLRLRPVKKNLYFAFNAKHHQQVINAPI